MAYFLPQSVRNLLAKAIGLKFSSSFCHRVAPSPVLQASVVMKFSFFLDQSVLSMVLPLFLFLIVRNRHLFLLSIPILYFFSAIFSFCLFFFWIDCSKILTSVVSSPEIISVPWCLWVLSISLSLLFYLNWFYPVLVYFVSQPG